MYLLMYEASVMNYLFHITVDFITAMWGLAITSAHTSPHKMYYNSECNSKLSGKW